MGSCPKIEAEKKEINTTEIIKIMDNKRKIIVVECISSSLNYIKDIIDAGYEPIILESWIADEETRDFYRKCLDIEYSLIPCNMPQVIFAKEIYVDILNIIKSMSPIAIIPGSDLGIELATRLSNDLGLRGNDLSRLPFMRYKDMMHVALKEAGLRYISGKKVSNVDEGLEYYRTEFNGRKVIVKPLHGGGAVGVFACVDERELIEAIVFDLDEARKQGEENPAVLIQEMIEGTEFYVNAVSKDGKHTITNICCYHMTHLSGRRPIYDYARSVSPHDVKYAPLIEYTVKMLDAVGVTCGASHNELMVDADGPVLVEVNARAAGGHQFADFQNRVLGIHETELSLRAYLGEDPTISSQGVKALATSIKDVLAYPLKSNGQIMFVLSVRDIDAVKAPILDLLPTLISYHSHFGLTVPKHYYKSTDLSNVMGLIYMCNDDNDLFEADSKLIYDIELNHPEKMFV